MSNNFVPYANTVETIQPAEAQVFDEIAATMREIAHNIGDRQRHTTRAVHAKSHALLEATVTVPDGLPEPLRQGFCAAAGEYGAVRRFSTNPGDILSDHISTPRGLAMKIVGVNGEMLPDHAGQVTQDFVLVNGKVFETEDAAGFLKNLQMLDKHANDPQALKQVVSTTARVAENVLETVGLESATLKVTAKAQEVYSDARRVWVDELLSFNPWHALAAHRPLGNIMRARFQAYAMSSEFRTAREGRKLVEPRSIQEMPA